MFFFLPLGTTRPCWRTPYLTYGLLSANALVFVIQQAAGEALPQGFIPAHPSLWAWFISIFMHAGIFHLAGNSLFLWLFGTIAEDVLGPWLFLLFYLGGDVGAMGLDALLDSLSGPEALMAPHLGASGAIAGIMGLSAVCFLRTKVRVWYLVGWFWYLWFRTDVIEIGAPVFLGLWVGWEFLQGAFHSALGIPADVAHWAHVGGFAAGLFGAVALRLNKRIPRLDLVSGRVPVTSSFEAAEQAGELQEMLAESPNDPEAWHALGRDYEMAGRTEKAREAYGKALFLFLEQRRMPEAARAYAGMSAYGLPTGLTADQQFDIACALEEAGKAKEAYGLFCQNAAEHPQGERAETALIRGGELALSSLHDGEWAAACYRRLLEAYPYSTWCALAKERLEELGMPEKPSPAPGQPAPESAAQPDPDLRPLGG